eukprot:TRINITY_DN8462_c0_g1_i1.p1 TRINITY_DN8462_c0_g1~~TRINITY_DN8462_c0_g1_i1.p1  ORF type:complete len:462 (+),score=143.93 TRINITY_DN8462_c0_g1_i1:436-1821(+)
MTSSLQVPSTAFNALSSSCAVPPAYLQRPPDLNFPKKNVARNPFLRQKPCKFFHALGQCDNNGACTYSHEEFADEEQLVEFIEENEDFLRKNIFRLKGRAGPFISDFLSQKDHQLYLEREAREREFFLPPSRPKEKLGLEALVSEEGRRPPPKRQVKKPAPKPGQKQPPQQQQGQGHGQRRHDSDSNRSSRGGRGHGQGQQRPRGPRNNYATTTSEQHPPLDAPMSPSAYFVEGQDMMMPEEHYEADANFSPTSEDEGVRAKAALGKDQGDLMQLLLTDDSRSRRDEIDNLNKLEHFGKMVQRIAEMKKRELEEMKRRKQKQREEQDENDDRGFGRSASKGSHHNDKGEEFATPQRQSTAPVVISSDTKAIKQGKINFTSSLQEENIAKDLFHSIRNSIQKGPETKDPRSKTSPAKDGAEKKTPEEEESREKADKGTFEKKITEKLKSLGLLKAKGSSESK